MNIFKWQNGEYFNLDLVLRFSPNTNGDLWLTLISGHEIKIPAHEVGSLLRFLNANVKND